MERLNDIEVHTTSLSYPNHRLFPPSGQPKRRDFTILRQCMQDCVVFSQAFVDELHRWRRPPGGPGMVRCGLHADLRVTGKGNDARSGRAQAFAGCGAGLEGAGAAFVPPRAFCNRWSFFLATLPRSVTSSELLHASG